MLRKHNEPVFVFVVVVFVRVVDLFFGHLEAEAIPVATCGASTDREFAEVLYGETKTTVKTMMV